MVCCSPSSQVRGRGFDVSSGQAGGSGRPSKFRECRRRRWRRRQFAFHDSEPLHGSLQNWRQYGVYQNKIAAEGRGEANVGKVKAPSFSSLKEWRS
mmetsp:Transcript_13026/g.14124  ORF Transcript_13026/g.14124 Transcript_13026/m.14124 type:complete len:96 (-) Transcript_13026:151-438(-)